MAARIYPPVPGAPAGWPLVAGPGPSDYPREQMVIVTAIDPGAVGAGKLWVDISVPSVPVYNIRNAADSGWVAIANPGAIPDIAQVLTAGDDAGDLGIIQLGGIADVNGNFGAAGEVPTADGAGGWVWLPKAAGGGATIVQFVGAATGSGAGTITLPIAPTVGNKLICGFAQRDGSDAAVLPTDFTLVAFDRNSGRSKSTTSYRDVIGGDDATWPYSIDSNGHYFMMEVAGLAAGAEAETQSSNGSGGAAVGTPMVCGGAGFLFIYIASQDAGLPVTPLGLADFGLVGGGSDPTGTALFYTLTEADTLTPALSAGFVWGMTGGFWTLA